MNANPSRGSGLLGHRLVIAGLIVALASAAAMVVSGFGYRLDLWHFRTGFAIIRWAFWFALAGASVSLAGLLMTGGKPGRILVAGLASIAIGTATAYMPWSLKRTAESLPYIHDISTDTANPPQFVAAAKLRKPDDHPVSYDGPEVADLQKQGYPDLAPLLTGAPRDKVFEAAKATIASMGMQLVDADPAQGRIEATHTSRFYGFTDDMVVRIAPVNEGTRVDVRSKSRVGRSDVGQNANRIRKFLQQLASNLG